MSLLDETSHNSDIVEGDGISVTCAEDLGTKESGPKQPVMSNKQYPVRDGRRFNSGYYQKFKWIEFSRNTNEAYCYPCRHFSGNACNSGEILGKRVSIDIGYQKFKDIAESCHKHENSKRHKNAIESWNNYTFCKQFGDKSMSIKDSLASTSDKEKEVNRKQIKIVLDAIILIARMG